MNFCTTKSFYNSVEDLIYYISYYDNYRIKKTLKQMHIQIKNLTEDDFLKVSEVISEFYTKISILKRKDYDTMMDYYHTLRGNEHKTIIRIQNLLSKYVEKDWKSDSDSDDE